MKHDGLGFDFSVLDIDLVAGEDNRNIFADADEITMPVGHVLVGDARCHVEHDDSALTLDVVTVTEATELLLTCGIPNVETENRINTLFMTLYAKSTNLLKNMDERLKTDKDTQEV